MPKQEPNQVVKEFRAGAIWATIYTKEAVHNGRSFTEHSIRIQRHWKDERTNQWGSTTYFRPEDLPKLILVAGKAFEHVMLKEVAEESRQPQDVQGANREPQAG